jgi:glycolate oxidase
VWQTGFAGLPGPDSTLIADLGGAGDVSADPDILASYRHDQAAPGLLAAGAPAALVRPRTTAEVQAAMRAAARHGVAVVPRGAGSGLSGGANAVDGCLVLCLERMTSVVAVDAAALTVTAEAGALNAGVDAAAREQGLWYPPDPASREFSTIGGNVATNAGGLCCVKYGVTRDSLLELEVVLADGRAVRLGHRTRKGVAGYDLAGLICGSEGTLGVITEVTARLQIPPRPAATLAATFADLPAAGAAIEAIVRQARPSLLELMDGTTVAAVEAMSPMDFDPGLAALVFARSDAGGAVGREEIELIERLCAEAGATFVATSDEEAEGRMLTAARRLAYPALERQGATLLDDVAVPIPAIVALLGGVDRIAAEQGVTIGTFGHAGDGNMHPTIVYDRDDPGEVARARTAFAAILDLALSLGGTITGEHGVGLLKREWLGAELGEALELSRTIKRALDPAGILNPGKAI